MGFQIAKDEFKILDIKRLTYKNYVENMGWTPELDNPSHFRIVDAPEGPYLDDDFALRSTYFGYFQSGKLVAGGRFIIGQIHEIEVSRYLKTGLPNYGPITLAEVNRLCLTKEILNTPILPILFVEILNHLAQHKLCDRALTTVAFPNPGELFCKLGFDRDSEPFRYGKNDFEPVSAVSLDLGDSEKLKKLKNVIGNLYGTRI
jgi:hypothetical protein